MLNCLNFGGDDNCCLWILIILLILCTCGGTVRGIFDKLCNCECLLPLLVVWLCACGDGGCGGRFGCK